MMPSTSKKQHNLMAAVANNPAVAKKTGIPKSVGEEFTKADKGIKFKGGSSSRPDLQRVNNPNTRHGKMELFKEGGDMASKMNPGFMAMIAKKKGAAASPMGKPTMKKGMDMAKDGMKKMATGGYVRAADGVASKGKTKATKVKMNKGGMAC
jgi:hypothetical protein